jgi:hypothetical protein
MLEDMRKRLAVAAFVLGLTIALTPAAGAKGTPPFKYVFRITAVDITATITYGKARATSRVRLERPSKTKWLSWFGDKPKGRPTTLADAALYFRGQAAYSSTDPACAKTLDYRSSKTHPVKGDVWFGQPNARAPFRVYWALRDFPIAEPIPGQDAGLPFSGPERCGNLEVGWYDNAEGTAPLSVFQKHGYTFVDRRHARLDEPEGSVDWTVRMTVKRLTYHRIDCATEPGC